jgi:hypothetical protein
MKQPIQISHDFLSEVLDGESIAVDATMGNGNDTVFLASLAKEVYAFDIQEQALQNTQVKLDASGLDNVHLILDGHEHVDEYVQKIHAAIFNLGYLPSADKSLVTKPNTTLEALNKILSNLEVGGRVSIMVYYGHKGGELEKNQVLTYVESLPQKKYTVMAYRSLNQVHTPPFLIMVEKVKA